jgi:hypothetical protein
MSMIEKTTEPMNPAATAASDTGTGQTLSTNPPPMTPSGGGNVLAPSVKLQPRIVKRVSQNIPKPQAADIITEGAEAGTFKYTGQALVDRNGSLARGQYSEDEAYSELATMTPAARKAFLNRLQSIGIYGSSKPSATGFDTRDLSAMRDAIRYANSKGVTLDVAATLMASEFPRVSTTKSIRYSPKQDLRAVFKKTAQELLGRNLPDAEVERFVKAYQGMEKTEQLGGAAAPSAGVAAEQQVMRRQGVEADAVGALKLTQIMDQMIKALG